MLNIVKEGDLVAEPAGDMTGRKRQIFEAAVALILAKGLAATSTRAVTERAGVGTGLLSHYFRWSDLRAAAWKVIFEALVEAEFGAALPPEDSLERYFSWAFAPQARRYWQLWLEATDIAKEDAAMAAKLGEVQREMGRRMAAVLRAGTTAGKWRIADPEATALRLGALNDGLAGLLIAGAAGLDPKAAEEHLRRAFALECGAA